MDTLVITQVAERQWHALDDDLVVGRGDVSPRPDGRLFLSIDAWHDPVFDRLAAVMLAALPRPLYTVVDEADLGLTARWRRAGLTTRRREWEYVMASGAAEHVPAPRGVTTLPMGTAVRADHRRRGIARALLAHVLRATHERGVATVSAEVHEANTAAIALVESVGARRHGSNLELVIR